MADNNSILEKLDGLESRYEEVSTLITDPDVIADQTRYVKLTKEYKDLGDIMEARKKYVACLNAIKEAKDILANESDAMWLASMPSRKPRIFWPTRATQT